MKASPTNSSKKPQRRLAQRLSEEQYQDLKRLIPDRVRTTVFSVLIDGLIELLDNPEVGSYVIGAVITGDLKVSTILSKGIKKNDNS